MYSIPTGSWRGRGGKHGCERAFSPGGLPRGRPAVRGGGLRRRPVPRRPPARLPGRAAALLRAAGREGGARRRQHLHPQGPAHPVDLAVVRRSLLPALLRRGIRPRRAPRARPELAGLRRHRRRRRPRRHQPPRHRGRGRDHRGPRRPARIRRRAGGLRRTHGPRHPALRRWRRNHVLSAARRFGRARGRRPGARHRQSLRRRADGDQRHRVGPGANPGRHLGPQLLHPDRRRHQPRQLGTAPWSASTRPFIPRAAAATASNSPSPPTWCAR